MRSADPFILKSHLPESRTVIRFDSVRGNKYGDYILGITDGNNHINFLFGSLLAISHLAYIILTITLHR